MYTPGHGARPFYPSPPRGHEQPSEVGSSTSPVFSTLSGKEVTDEHSKAET